MPGQVMALSTAALQEAMAFGIPRDKATSIVALSWREVAVVIVQPWVSPFTEMSGCGCRTAVGLELDRSRVETGCFMPSWLGDLEFMDNLVQLGVAQFDPVAKCMVPAGQLNHPNSDQTAVLLEWVMLERQAHLLDGFSIGPTQQHLKYSGPFRGEALCGWPQTWEDIFIRFSSTSAGDAIELITYLEPPCNNNPFPTSPVGDPHGKTIAWLKHNHTGNAAMAERYWTGAGAWSPGASMENAIWQCNSIANSLGYA